MYSFLLTNCIQFSKLWRHQTEPIQAHYLLSVNQYATFLIPTKHELDMRGLHETWIICNKNKILKLTKLLFLSFNITVLTVTSASIICDDSVQMFRLFSDDYYLSNEFVRIIFI